MAGPDVGSRPHLPRPTRWNATCYIIETDGRDCDHNFARLRIDHLDYLEYCSFFERFALVSSFDVACSCSASFQLFTRLLDSRSVMCFFLSFLACCWQCSFLACCWLCSFLACCWQCSFLVACVHHSSLLDLRHAPAPSPRRWTQIGTHVLLRPATCHVCRTRSSHLTQNHYSCLKEPIRACNSLAFNSSPGKLHDADETVLSCT